MKLDLSIAIVSVLIGLADCHFRNNYPIDIVLYPDVPTQATSAEIDAYLTKNPCDDTYYVLQPTDETDSRHEELLRLSLRRMHNSTPLASTQYGPTPLSVPATN